MSIATVVLFTVPLLPVCLAVGVHLSATARAAAPWAPLSGLVLVPLAGETVTLPWLLLEARVGLTDTFLPLLLLATVAWTIAGWHARRTLAETEQGRFWFFWLVTWCGNLCVFLTRDAASFYAAYAMMTFAAWGLIVHQRRPADFHAGRVYIAMALLGESLILGGLFILGAEFGNMALDDTARHMAASAHGNLAVWLFTAGFGVKMGLAGLHMWLPLAHPQAPVPASAVLSGVILKAGLAGWLVFLPLGVEGHALVGTVLAGAGMFTALYGVVAGIGQARAKTVLAYSSLSQMGLVTIPVGLGLAYPEHAAILTTVAVLFAVHHGLAKTALFLGVDVVARAPAIGRTLLWLPAASLAGLPLTSGAVAKVTLKAELPAAAATWLQPLLLVSSLATTLLLARFLWLAWPREPGHGPVSLALPWSLLIALGVVLPWLLAGAADGGWLQRPFAASYLLETLLPVVAGSAAALIAVRRWRHVRLPRIPEGDIIALLQYLPATVRLPTKPFAAEALPRWPGPPLLGTVEGAMRIAAIAFTVWLTALALLFALAAMG